MVGNGPYAKTLASLLEAGFVPLERVEAPVETDSEGRTFLIFEDLERVLFVVPHGMSDSEILRHHRRLLEWVARLSSAGDQHDLTFIFILDDSSHGGFKNALAAGLGIAAIIPETGHTVFPKSGALSELLDLLRLGRPFDLASLRARQASDSKRTALARLRLAVGRNESAEARAAAEDILRLFAGREHLIDLFCRPPAHQNGNSLRHWLREVSIGSLAQGDWRTAVGNLADWLGTGDNLGAP